MAEKFTQFDYLLNAMLDACRHENPAEHGYGEKRRKLYGHVRELERKAAAYDALPADGVDGPLAREPRERAKSVKLKCQYHPRDDGNAEYDSWALGVADTPAAQPSEGSDAP